MTVHGFQREKNNEFRVRSGVGNKIKNIGIRWNVWEYHSTADRQYYADDIRDHPARFPEPLAKDHIISWSNEYDVVLDPFCGSGTTVKMAKAENRYYIGIEISPKYVEMGEKRISRVGIMNPCAHLGGNDEKAE
jgi:site-specific DNA-methyltransferase (adenine-specific)